MKAVKPIFAVVFGIMFSQKAWAGSYLVIGVVADTTPGKGVALIKEIGSERTFAIRDGQSFNQTSQILSIRRKSVEFLIEGKKLEVAVGENTNDATASRHSPSPSMTNDTGVGYVGLEREGSTTRVSASVVQHILKNDLSKVLMQAAAVPQYRNGQLAGFSLFDIEPGSVYEQIGLKEGDMVTHINGQGLNDVGNTIKLLKSLKDEPNASMNLIRNGQAQTLSVVVQ